MVSTRRRCNHFRTPLVGRNTGESAQISRHIPGQERVVIVDGLGQGQLVEQPGEVDALRAFTKMGMDRGVPCVAFASK